MRRQSVHRAWEFRRHGLASMLAMLYLVLFATMAIGFYSATTISTQISRNERALSLAHTAADGGMQYVRYQLGAMTLDSTVTPSGLMNAVAAALGQRLNGSPNMGGHAVQNSNGTIYLPYPGGWTTIDGSLSTKFRAKIEQSGEFLVVTVTGAGPAATTLGRAVQLHYQKAPKAGFILDYGVATRGTISTGGSTIIQGQTDPTKGSVLSTDMTSSTPISVGGSGITGDASVVNPDAAVTGGPIGGTSDPTQIQTHIHKGVPAPTFPTIDISVFTAYATNKYTGGSTLTNCYIPPNTNPKFAGGTTINGVLWVQAPNVVSFRGNCTINGVIVCDNSGPFDPAHNQLSFSGNVSSTPVSQLDPATYGNLTTLTGSFLLAPTFAVSMTGDFGTINGSVVAGQISMTGNAQGVVQGSVIGMTDNPLTLNGHSSITISSTGTSQFPTGMSFGNDYTPLPGTYLEVLPSPQ